MQAHATERGQALILIVFAMVVLFGFTALAIDIGLLYSERARAQNAADSAAFAAAIADTQGRDFVQAARNLARANGFDHDSPDFDVIVTRTVNGSDTFYEVDIRAEYKPFLSHFVYSGKMENKVEAVTRIESGGAGWAGSALVATSPNACQAMCLGGNVDVTADRGHIFSNSNRVGSGDSNPCHSLAVHGNVDLTMINGSSLLSVGSYYKFGGSGSVTVNPPGDILQNQSPITTLPTVNDPGCATMAVQSSPTFPPHQNSITIQPGYYPSGISLSGGQKSVTFAPGIYCIDNGLVATLRNATGSNVFFYVRSGEVRIEGSASVNLTGGHNLPGDPSHTYENQLLYMPFGNANRVRIAGGSDLFLSGRIYAPEKRLPDLSSNPCDAENAPYKCELVGNSDTSTINSQVICDTVRVKGTAELDLTFSDPNAPGAGRIFELYR